MSFALKRNMVSEYMMQENHLLVFMKFGFESFGTQMLAEGDKFASEINKFADEIRAIGPNSIRL